MNYQPVSAGNRTNGYAGSETNSDARQAGKEKMPDQEYILLPLLHTSSYFPSSSKEAKPNDDVGKEATEQPSCVEGDKTDDLGSLDQQVKFGDDAENINSTNSINTASPTVNTAGDKNEYFQSTFDKVVISTPITVNAASSSFDYQDARIFYDAYNDRDEGAEADYNNLETVIAVSPIPSTRANKDHPKDQIIGEVHSAVQKRKMIKQTEAGLITFINKQRRTNHKDFHNCLFACFLSQMEPNKTLVDLPYGKKAISTKWVFRNKVRLVAQGHRQEEGIDYDEVFAPVARIEAIRLFLAYASFMGFTVYQMDVKSAFLYGTIEEKVYVSQPPGFVDPEFPERVYKVKKALYGLHQAPRAWYETLSTYLMENGFRRETIDKTLFIKKIKNDILLVQVYVDDIIFGSTKESLSTEFEKLMHKRFQMSSMEELTFFLGLQVEQRKDGIFLSQDKYVGDILQKFGFSSVKSASTPMETYKPLSKDADGTYVDVHLYRESLDYKGQPTLGLWYPKDSPMELIAYSDSDYAGASLDRKLTTQAEYIAASNCCRQVLWLQNQFLDYGYNFMQTRIHMDNKSAMCVVKNHVYHLKTKHIEIRHHFIRDSYEKKLIEMVKIHTDYNVADVLTKAFDVARFQFLIASIALTSVFYSLPLMAYMEFCDKHNMVAFLQKPTGSEEFHQIVDFLPGSHIRYALTANPTIYVSLIEQFWQTVTVETINEGEQQLIVTVDGQTFAITEASVRRHL
ncbi:putative ribonuclease H-like domain-containing protein [Tanacetum coccineum]|uniref:Ribonuclease H-like domain-containing protein n=1 Tax=Tanacetum coccineum TaxID=301880 RepID=A0ABQ4X9S2_9ASTR